MTLHELFKKRQAHYMKQLVKYGQLVFNDHFILILVLFVGALGYTYSTWLQTIDDSATHLVFIALTVGFMSIFGEVPRLTWNRLMLYFFYQKRGNILLFINAKQ